MPYTMKPLSCDPARVKGMSERLIVSHYENNYGGAVKRLNPSSMRNLRSLSSDPSRRVPDGLKREQLIAINSMILHELFFDGLGDQSEPGSALRDAITRDFGSIERWRAEFVAMGKALGGGSGWVPSWSPRDRRLAESVSLSLPHAGWGDADPGARYVRALLSYSDFGAKATSYVDCFMEVIRWQNAERRFKSLSESSSI